ANSRCASVFLGIVKRFGGTTPFKPSFGAPADAIRSGGAPDNECTVSFVTATRRLMTSPWEIGNQVLRAFPVRHGAFRATWKCSVCLYAMFNPKPVSASGRHNLAATRLKNAAVPVAITAVLHAVTGLGDAYERACRCTDSCAGQRAARVAANGCSGKTANCGTADTIAGCSSFISRAPARSGAYQGHRHDAVQDHSHRNILPILMMRFTAQYIGRILKGQDMPLVRGWRFLCRNFQSGSRGKPNISASHPVAE